MLKQIEAQISNMEIVHLGHAVIMATVATTLWGVLQGFSRQTYQHDWTPVIIWGFLGFALGPGLGIAVRFPQGKLRPWPQFGLALARGVAYGVFIFVGLQLMMLTLDRPLRPQDRPFIHELDGLTGFIFLSVLFVIAHQLDQHIAQIRASGFGWSRMLIFGILGLPPGVLCWSIYFQIPFRESSAEAIQLFQEIWPILIVCSIPMIFIGMALGIVSSAHKISISGLADNSPTSINDVNSLKL